MVEHRPTPTRLATFQGLYGNVVATHSVGTPVHVSISTGTSGGCQFPCNGALPGGSNNEALMDGFCRFNGTCTVEIRNLDPGYSNVYTYGWAPDDALARTTVDGVSLGGAWPANNALVLGTTHAVRSGVPVAAGAPLTIQLSVAHSFGTLNGVQLVFTGATLGVSYCLGVPNSTGWPAGIVAFGSPTVLDNELFISCAGLPRHSFAFFLTCLTPGFMPNAGGSSGNLCLGGARPRRRRADLRFGQLGRGDRARQSVQPPDPYRSGRHPARSELALPVLVPRPSERRRDEQLLDRVVAHVRLSLGAGAPGVWRDRRPSAIRRHSSEGS